MDTKSFVEPIVETPVVSRLPAGSTLLVNGLQVPHPHAEVNLAGKPDPRLGDTDAVTEFVGDSGLETRPLDESVKVKVADAPAVVVALVAEPVVEPLPPTV
jgi:hypothetical protein